MELVGTHLFDALRTAGLGCLAVDSRMPNQLLTLEDAELGTGRLATSPASMIAIGMEVSGRLTPHSP